MPRAVVVVECVVQSPKGCWPWRCRPPSVVRTRGRWTGQKERRGEADVWEARWAAEGARSSPSQGSHCENYELVMPSTLHDNHTSPNRRKANWAWVDIPMLRLKHTLGHSDHCARALRVSWSVHPLVWRETRPACGRAGASRGRGTWCEGINDLSRELGSLAWNFRGWVGCCQCQMVGLGFGMSM